MLTGTSVRVAMAGVLAATAVWSSPVRGQEQEHYWGVHDPARPLPPKVEGVRAVTTPAPSDAIVLFGPGAEGLHAWEHGDGSAAKWTVRDGFFEVERGTGTLRTKRAFGDIQLHLEWIAPASEGGDEGQARGNSGVFLMGLYEIQILESAGSRTYADGMGSSLYGQHPPMVNAGAGLGEWQSYDIVFRAPRFDGDEVVSPATVTVHHNGVLVHDAVDFQGVTRHMARTSYRPHEARRPLELQDHGDPIRFRNVWVRELEPKEIAYGGGWENPFPAGGEGSEWEFVSSGSAEAGRRAIEVRGDEIEVLRGWADGERSPDGYILTTRAHQNYDLAFEYRWGDRSFPPRAGSAPNAGVLLHVQDASPSGRLFWPRCVEYQLQKGRMGDVITLGGVSVRDDRSGEVLEPAEEGGVVRLPRRGGREREGDWNAALIEVRGDSARFFVNGELANEVSGFRHRGETWDRGRVGLQVEGTELTYRGVRIRPRQPE